MTTTRSQQAGAVVPAGANPAPRAMARGGLRIVLLGLAVAILLLGAVTAGVAGYLMLSRG